MKYVKPNHQIFIPDDETIRIINRGHSVMVEITKTDSRALASVFSDRDKVDRMNRPPHIDEQNTKVEMVDPVLLFAAAELLKGCDPQTCGIRLNPNDNGAIVLFGRINDRENYIEIMIAPVILND